MWRKIVVLAIVCLWVNTVAGLPGSGTQQNPWRIQSLADFNEFSADANYWDDYTRLETDVNLAGQSYTTAVIAPDTEAASSGFQGNAFTGVFDGNDKRIINLTIDDKTGNDYLGLFGYIDDCQVSNLGLEGGNVCGTGDYVGGLVGGNSYPYTMKPGGIITNCYSTVDVSGSGDNVGGLVGWNYRGTVLNCYSTCDVMGTGAGVGGLVGSIEYGSILKCHSTGDVSGRYNVGGLLGNNHRGTVSNCYSTGSISGDTWVGGLMGGNSYPGGPGTITDCYSTGDVIGDGYVGGLLGDNAGTVSSCYSTGDVTGRYNVGGLVGYNYGNGTVTACFWDKETSGQTNSDGGSGKMTAEMQTESTFTEAGWDFVEIWNIGENQTYPYLRVYPAGNINHDDIVNMLDFSIFAGHWLEGTGY